MNAFEREQLPRNDELKASRTGINCSRNRCQSNVCTFVALHYTRLSLSPIGCCCVQQRASARRERKITYALMQNHRCVNIGALRNFIASRCTYKAFNGFRGKINVTNLAQFATTHDSRINFALSAPVFFGKNTRALVIFFTPTPKLMCALEGRHFFRLGYSSYNVR